MKGHAEISLSGAGFPTLRPSGVTLKYGLNFIPMATIDLNADHLALLCDFEQYRRKAVTIDIKTIKGCITFHGLIDGLSFYQSPGAIQAQLVVKHAFQQLLEVFPRMPGFHPTSLDIFKRVETLSMPDIGSVSESPISKIDISNFIKLDGRENVLKYFIKASQSAIKAQQYAQFVSSRGQDVSDIVQIAKYFSATKLPMAYALLDSIDTTYTDGMIMNAGDPMVTDWVVKLIQEASGNILENIMLNLNEFGAGMVIGDKKAYLIPESGFLRVPHEKNIPRGIQSTEPNIIYPSQMNSLSFNDTGYKDIKACYVVSDENVTLLNATLTGSLGYYIDPAAQGGILTLSLPLFVSLGLDWSVVSTNLGIQRNIRDRVPNVTTLTTPEAVAKTLLGINEKDLNFVRAIRDKVTNNWAQMKYLQAKYADRTGNINAYFNPHWAPGAVGTLYTRLPGTYLDFFVTDVQHRFSVAGGVGEASTNISFNCGRVGKSAISSGLDKIDLYDYDYDRSKSYAAAFIADITNPS